MVARVTAWGTSTGFCRSSYCASGIQNRVRVLLRAGVRYSRVPFSFLNGYQYCRLCVFFLRLVLTRDSPVLCYLFRCADSKTWNPSRCHLSRLRPPSVPLAVCWSPVIKCDAFTASPPSTSFYRERWCPLHHRQPLLRTPPLSPLDQPTVKAGRLGTLGSCDCHRTGRT
jgi:hypothetical protein